MVDSELSESAENRNFKFEITIRFIQTNEKRWYYVAADIQTYRVVFQV